jgi:hypothetical protein
LSRQLPRTVPKMMHGARGRPLPLTMELRKIVFRTVPSGVLLGTVEVYHGRRRTLVPMALALLDSVRSTLKADTKIILSNGSGPSRRAKTRRGYILISASGAPIRWLDRKNELK